MDEMVGAGETRARGQPRNFQDKVDTGEIREFAV
jgi:hypothetical protein